VLQINALRVSLVTHILLAKRIC